MCVRALASLPAWHSACRGTALVTRACGSSVQELAALGSSAEGCCEREEIEARLLEVRRAHGQDQHVGGGQAAAAQTAAPPPGMEHFISSMTASFNTMGDSFGIMVGSDSAGFGPLRLHLQPPGQAFGSREGLCRRPSCFVQTHAACADFAERALQMQKVTDKFDTLDNKLDDLESKRGQLRQVPWTHTANLRPVGAFARSDPTLPKWADAVKRAVHRFGASQPGKILGALRLTSPDSVWAVVVHEWDACQMLLASSGSLSSRIALARAVEGSSRGRGLRRGTRARQGSQEGIIKGTGADCARTHA